jgi:hypothetical protein
MKAQIVEPLTADARQQLNKPVVNDRPILSSEMLHKYYDGRCSVGKKLLVVSLNGLVAKTN